MKRSVTTRSLVFAAISVGLSLATSMQPAHAQYYFNNLPYALSSSLLYPIGRIFLGGGTSIYNIANPYYLTNRLVNGGINSSGYFRAPGYGPMPMGVSGYTDEEPLNTPRQRTRPFRYGQWGVDQTAYAGGYIAPNPDAVVPQTVGQPGAPGMPAIIPPQQASQMPPTAPQRNKHNKHSKNQQVAQYSPPAVASALPQAASTAASPAPLAQGFITMVNTKYDGDISKALFNAEGRSWAHTVGLVDNNDIFSADLSQERVNVIGKIFKDPGLDPVSKLDAVKILLRSTPPATAAAPGAAAP
jgi:hypothetical protein